MIYLLVGDDWVSRQEFIESLKLGDDVESYDGEDLQEWQVADIFNSLTLFSSKRTVFINQPSKDEAVWRAIGDWLGQADDVDVILIESSVDKRTKTYKELKKTATIKEFTPWRDYQRQEAMKWLKSYLAKKKLEIDSDLLNLMIDRAGVVSSSGKPVIDKGLLYSAVNSLSCLDKAIDREAIDAVMPKNGYDSVFNLLEMAINGRSEDVHQKITNLRTTEDVYQVTGLLSSQVFNLIAIYRAQKAGIRSDELAKILAIHPYVLSQLTPLVNKLDQNRLNEILDNFINMDRSIKSSQIEPWSAVEMALVTMVHERL
ncbi:hypothetical protein CR956_00900 [Candidatus Saccharibacteria bacterium]|nr:MAG: hypothetical protein CR956_00900 [Candidatus Saccharibacteria bacterium]